MINGIIVSMPTLCILICETVFVHKGLWVFVFMKGSSMHLLRLVNLKFIIYMTFSFITIFIRTLMCIY